LGESDIAGTLKENLAEEKAADEILTGIAETQANPKGES